jgi:hypothetical protein
MAQIVTKKLQQGCANLLQADRFGYPEAKDAIRTYCQEQK